MLAYLAIAGNYPALMCDEKEMRQWLHYGHRRLDVPRTFLILGTFIILYFLPRIVEIRQN
jgi:hypothetical protein